MLVIDIYTLLFVYALYFLEEVLIYTFNAVQPQDILRVERALGDVVTSQDIFSFCNAYPCAVRDLVYPFFLASHLDLRLVIHRRIYRNYSSVSFTYHSKTLRLPCLEQLLYSRQTVSDIRSGNSACVEGSHRQLSTRFTDRLSCSYTYSFTDINTFACSKVSSIALSTYTCSAVASHY